MSDHEQPGTERVDRHRHTLGSRRTQVGESTLLFIDAGRGHGLAEVAVLPPIDAELLGFTVEARGALPLFAP